ncbi:MAG TPA: GAF domain-containing protein [Longimicrobiaceae bacterium]|nr:GAF domain-containing protein [Longimicrobiaceae bacterium]
MAEYTLVAEKTGERRLDAESRRARYAEIAEQIDAVLAGETDLTAAMATVACLLHNAFPYYFWTGFYRRVGPRELLVGPYQGTMGCLRIDFDRGVCGAAARERRTQLVPDVRLASDHIACDASSASEIVVPVLDPAGELIAVLDVDSDLVDAFDDVDREWLERIAALVGAKSPLPVVASAGRTNP